jgi:hypothetical protein
MLARRHSLDILEWDNFVEFCSLMLARRHAFDIFEWDALCHEQYRSIFPYLCLQFRSKYWLKRVNH